jgi:hypothetical protein
MTFSPPVSTSLWFMVLARCRILTILWVCHGVLGAAPLIHHWPLGETVADLPATFDPNYQPSANRTASWPLAAAVGAPGLFVKGGLDAPLPAFGPPSPGGVLLGRSGSLGIAESFARIQLGNASPDSGTFTISLWFRMSPGAPIGTSQRHILGTNSGQSGRWNLMVLPPESGATAPSLRFFHQSPDAWGSGGNATGNVFILANTFEQGRWYHFAASRDISNQFTLYLDGQPRWSATNTGPFTNGANGLVLGRYANLTTQSFHGLFDDLRIFGGALDAAAVAQLASTPPPVPPLDLPPAPSGESVAIRDPYGWVPGNPIANSSNHPSLFLGTPSVIRLPDGALLASHDHFGPASTGLPCRILRSEDNGLTWNQIATLDAKWSSFFLHQGALYFMGPNIATNRVLIRRSNDGGFTWTEPTGPSDGILLSGSFHSSAMPVLEHNGRLWRTMEDQNGPSSAWGRAFRAFMMSAPLGANLLDSASWTSSNPLASSTAWLGGTMYGWLEGNAVAAPDGSVKNILRVHTSPLSDDTAAVIHISPDGTTATFDPNGRPDIYPSDPSGYITLPGATKKFLIRRDPLDGSYWSLTSHILPQDLGGNPERTRNTLALIRSTNLYQWDIRSILLHHPAVDKYGFHYVDWRFDGAADLIVASRAAWNANSQHDSNLILFHQFGNFRELDMDSSFPSGESRWEYPDLVVEGIGFRPALLANGERSFSNRSYRWQNVPADLAGRLITCSNGNQNRRIHVTARRETTLTAVTNSNSGPAGWSALGVLFGYDAGGNTPMYGFSRSMSAGERIEVPQLGFSGTLPLIDSGSRPLAVWRVAPDALPAVADSENAFHIDTINGAGPVPAQGVSGAGLDFSDALAPVTSANQLGLVDMDFTLCAWIRSAAGDFTPDQHVIGKGATAEGAGWLLTVDAGRARFTAGSPPATLRSTTPVNDGHWHHIAVVFRRGDIMSLHINGGAAETGSAAPAIPSNTGPLFLGGAGGSLAFRGALDEIRLYPRPLETTEIRSLFLNPPLDQPVAGGGLPLEIRSHPANGLFLTWPAVPGRNYDIHRSESLVPGSWLPAATIVAAGDRIVWPVPLDTPAAFFHVIPADP